MTTELKEVACEIVEAWIEISTGQYVFVLTFNDLQTGRERITVETHEGIAVLQMLSTPRFPFAKGESHWVSVTANPCDPTRDVILHRLHTAGFSAQAKLRNFTGSPQA